MIKLLDTRERSFLVCSFPTTEHKNNRKTHTPLLFLLHTRQYGVCVVHDDEKEALVAIIIVIVVVVVIIIRTRTSVVSKKKKNKRRPTNHRLVVVVVTDGRKKTASARDDAGGLFAAVLEREKKGVRAVFRPDVPGEVRGELRVSVGYFERRWEERC